MIRKNWHLQFNLSSPKNTFVEREKLTNDPILMQFVLKDSAKMPIRYKSVKALQRIAYCSIRKYGDEITYSLRTN